MISQDLNDVDNYHEAIFRMRRFQKCGGRKEEIDQVAFFREGGGVRKWRLEYSVCSTSVGVGIGIGIGKSET
ncbi:predicted protein [Sclerotinia sclerotiorum 1980 UF-70]|uniref:Uncharacterized protein n=1 Tax=Sclerotinia sclerotiorum (strain ATCC 18683 / 1980 / Ss-1) TaxID=665079 RepID=A7E8W6_SCLS1|nr:predicted protein [Sclerotinia sclerotiorum 1980 UF-70]EDN96818.1 predicted protein [Sclerotinia sclerotiorum 1980 UF-70]